MLHKIILIGNPNVGKSTIFNRLTGLNQHTGNWTGKTVDTCHSNFTYQHQKFELIDLPGTYSLNSLTEEEQVTTNYIINEDYDMALVIADATNLEKSLNLIFQTLEITKKVIVVINIIDEASKKGIIINSKKLSKILDVPIVLTDARKNIGINKLLDTIINYQDNSSFVLKYNELIENYLINLNNLDRYNKLRYLEKNEDLKEEIIMNILEKSKSLVKEVVRYTNNDYNKKDKFLDKLLTSKITGIPIMFGLLFLCLYLTISLSNYPSTFLFKTFNFLENKIFYLFNLFLPLNITNLLVLGIYKTTTWIISVMLPPMIIFFPLFAILEEYGFLPRIAFNMDYLFSKCNASGKQCLTMLMGFGCNAVGCSNSRIMESKREKLLAILTNVFVPCNGRFPSIIALISLFLATNSILSSFYLTLFITLSIFMTFLVSKILSKTLLKGYSSTNILELPSYRRPKIIKLIIKTIVEKVLTILKRTIIISIPTSLFLYLITNLNINNNSILSLISHIFNSFGNLIGLDGMIILAFILGFPANEIVLPILLMGYLRTNSLVEYENLEVLKNILINNGWTILTSINFIILSLFHFPCSTTILTIKKETNSLKWTIISFLLPTFIGIILCILIKNIYLFLKLVIV